MDYFHDYKGLGFSGSIDVTDAGVTIPEHPCKMVKLDNFDVRKNLIDANNVEVFWGFDGNYAHSIRPAGSSDAIWVSNAGRITLRTRPGEAVTIYYSVLW